MFLRILLIGIAVVGLSVGGCSKKETAETPVTAENLDSELDKLEKQIEADIAAE